MSWVAHTRQDVHNLRDAVVELGLQHEVGTVVITYKAWHLLQVPGLPWQCPDMARLVVGLAVQCFSKPKAQHVFTVIDGDGRAVELEAVLSGRMGVWPRLNCWTIEEPNARRI